MKQTNKQNKIIFGIVNNAHLVVLLLCYILAYVISLVFYVLLYNVLSLKTLKLFAQFYKSTLFCVKRSISYICLIVFKKRKKEDASVLWLLAFLCFDKTICVSVFFATYFFLFQIPLNKLYFFTFC